MCRRGCAASGAPAFPTTTQISWGELTERVVHHSRIEAQGTGARIATVAAAVCCGALLLAPSAGARPHCAGKPATVLKHRGHITGTARPDVIVAGAGTDTISAGGGRDLICSGGGADLVNGGNGRDKIFAGPGDDTIVGGAGGEGASGGRGAGRGVGGPEGGPPGGPGGGRPPG